ncbi:tRNA 2-thiouridine(34) synthase MnmA [Cellulomonas marina]|uniref:tRNA-specific 2-thiouridylase MnmA n=1 Tax=Cellulomonas marina TaxID=988821 RepID=A0A1I0YKT2_9CELL|nr:tRNA 2-thiouridine(34) synthase MnmA [Cellulomonas marina]GIG30692.1 tRNA-specific 2-thiouridylase MnmA [Cellulomonas marina]SFB13999.1 tRNA-specific 2-thiouridylase [Cellulomonas marina]
MRVLAALSGGVDSAVAAARAQEAGHDVVGVHMALSRQREQHRTGSRGCCSIEDAGDARRAADVLGIPFYVWDLSERFERTVVADFLSEYAAGRTPNPCVRCNEHVKFAALLDKALALGFDAVCTGHYARLVAGPDGVPALHRARDAAKDQSYVLAVTGPERLARTLFPLGDAASKDEVRREAAARGLPVASKPDSYDICFVADGDTRGFLDRALGTRPGEVVDTDGAVLGSHDGAHGFTVGQRRGLRLGRPAPDGRPRYVLAVEPVRNRVVVGSAEDLAVGWITADRAVWYVPAPGAEPVDVLVQVRAHGTPVPAVVRLRDGVLDVRVAEEAGLRGVAAGQSLVLYDGDRVLGQATVTGAGRARRAPADDAPPPGASADALAGASGEGR